MGGIIFYPRGNIVNYFSMGLGIKTGRMVGTSPRSWNDLDFRLAKVNGNWRLVESDSEGKVWV